jgi:hypothetical protein
MLKIRIDIILFSAICISWKMNADSFCGHFPCKAYAAGRSVVLVYIIFKFYMKFILNAALFFAAEPVPYDLCGSAAAP